MEFGFVAIQFNSNTNIMCEKIIFNKDENVTKDNYKNFHDDNIFKETVFVKKNVIINVVRHGLKLERIKC